MSDNKELWRHLLPYGYAPGHYMGSCATCSKFVFDLDKRAVNCRPCAEAKHAATTAHTNGKQA